MLSMLSCEWCGRGFHPANMRQRFCGEDCREDAAIPRKEERTPNTWLTPGFTAKLRNAVMDRDGRACYICGREHNLHVHHIIPRHDGGPHTMDNLVTLCSGCHRSVESGNIETAIRSCMQRAVTEVKKRVY